MTIEPDLPDPDCRTMAQAYLRDEPALLSSRDFGPLVAQGIGPGPSVLIGDQAEISLLRASGAYTLDHRMALLARGGDTVLVRRRVPEFETYLAECLGLEEVSFQQVQFAPHRPVACQARVSQALCGTLAEKARGAGGLTLKAYLTTGNVWRLAQAIAEMSGARVHVCGPSPRTTTRVNDKLWFSQLARRVIGRDAVPPTMAAYGPAAAAGLVRRIGRAAGQVIVKVPDSAGSAGNIRLDSADLAQMPLAALRRFLLARLHATGWHDSYPILVGVWDENVRHSPSAQMWIPFPSEGPPHVEAIFEQRVRGAAAKFVGAARATLPADQQMRLSTEAARIGRVLQRLGYYGRCSLDAVLCANPAGPAIIHWIECNGRWGGVSIPMTAAQQLLEVSVPPAISILQEKLPDVTMRSGALRSRLEDLLFRRGRDRAGLVMLSPSESPQGASVNLMAMAEDQAGADAMLAEALRRIAAGG